jgi:acyl-CoA thioester hydrolase
MRPSFPSVEDVRLLPCFMSQEIPPEFEDINGHVNIQHYLGLYDKAGWPFFALLGMDERYFTEERKGIFDLEHHLFYLAEMHIGDRVAIHGRLLARSAKRLHGIWFIVNESQNQLANSFEFVSSHADLESRRTSPFPDELAGRLDAMISEHQKISWPAPVCGIMGA